MTVIQSQLDAQGDDFAKNREAMLSAIASFREVEQKVLDKAAEARPKFEKRGQLLPRERLNLLLDPGSPFLELCSLAGYKLHDDKDGTQAGGGIIAGIGYISGIRCLISASNSAIKGGTISPTGLKKTLRLQQIAMENKLPLVALTESGGANLNYAAEIFVEGARGFANQARISAMGIPQVTVVHGSSTAGGAAPMVRTRSGCAASSSGVMPFTATSRPRLISAFRRSVSSPFSRVDSGRSKSMRAESGEMLHPVTGAGTKAPSKCRQVCRRIRRWRRGQSMATVTRSPTCGAASPSGRASTCRMRWRSSA